MKTDCLTLSVKGCCRSTKRWPSPCRMPAKLFRFVHCFKLSALTMGIQAKCLFKQYLREMQDFECPTGVCAGMLTMQ